MRNEIARPLEWIRLWERDQATSSKEQQKEDREAWKKANVPSEPMHHAKGLGSHINAETVFCVFCLLFLALALVTSLEQQLQ